MCAAEIGFNDIKFVGEAGVASLKNVPKDIKKEKEALEEDDDYYWLNHYWLLILNIKL